mgnify:CR=1 FL=1
MEVTRTFVFQVRLSPEAEKAVQELAVEQGRWLKIAFRKLYADKRNHSWERFGPGVNQVSIKGKNYGPFVVLKSDGGYKVNPWALYPGFVERLEIDTWLDVEYEQVLFGRLATVWSNFLNSFINPELPSPRPKRPTNASPRRFRALLKDGKTPKGTACLPEFSSPIATLKVPQKRWKRDGLQLSFRFGAFDIPFVLSRSRQYKARTEEFFELLMRKTWSAVEVMRHDDGKWYAHIPVTEEVVLSNKCPDVVMGVDLGVRQTMTGAVVAGDHHTPLLALKHISGMRLWHELERAHARVRQLRSLADRGSKGAKRALDRAYGRRRNLNDTAVKTASARLVRIARSADVDLVAVESLRSLRSRHGQKRFNRKMNRAVTTWARGQARDKLVHRATRGGIAFVEVDARDTSTTCPRCGTNDPRARNRKRHEYRCNSCGYSSNDDTSAAINIARRGWKCTHPGRASFRSTSPAAGTGEDCQGQPPGRGELHQPEHADAAGAAAREGACGENPWNQTNGAGPGAPPGAAKPATSLVRTRCEPRESRIPSDARGQVVGGPLVTSRNQEPECVATSPRAVWSPPELESQRPSGHKTSCRLKGRADSRGVQGADRLVVDVVVRVSKAGQTLGECKTCQTSFVPPDGSRLKGRADSRGVQARSWNPPMVLTTRRLKGRADSRGVQGPSTATYQPGVE